jgi:hypothetical protein
MPDALSAEEIESTQSEARLLINDERSRSGIRVTPAPDPAVPHSGITDSDLKTMREKFPFLREFSDSFLRANKPECLIKMEATHLKMREIERQKDAEDRLAANRSALGSNPTLVKEGLDDRWSVLHPGRFLPGAGCSAAKLWLEARKVIGLSGVAPLGNYDMSSIGLGGFVTAKGWVELANPASAKMSIKLFNINNCKAKATNLKDGGDAELAEFSEIGEFQLALRTLRSAAMLAMPWNLSFTALENFLVSSHFCKDDIGTLDKQAQLLTSFTDYILAENASRWRNSEPFLSSGDLKSAWQSFFSARPQAALAKKAPQQTKEKQQPGNNRNRQNSNRTANRHSLPSIPVCYKWNAGSCAKPDGQCFTHYGLALRHVCDERTNPANLREFCGQAHKRIDFH